MTHLLSITQQQDGTYLVSGNTFPIKDTLKRCGGMWDAGRKAWIMPQDFDPAVLPQSSTVPANDDDETESPGRAATRPQPRGETMLIASTNTYGVRDQIVKAGGRWRPETKQWEVPANFDMSIIPKTEPKATAADGSPRVIHCGLCGEVGHAKNRCQCSHCGTVGFHRSDQCPTIHPRWKFLVQSIEFRCACNATALCVACENVCCRDAKPLPCACLLKTQCATHGENCHGTHE